MTAPVAPEPNAGAPPLLIDAVFGDARARASASANASRGLLAWFVAIAAHAALFLLAQQAGPSLEIWSARIAAMIHRDLRDSAPTSIETLAPPPQPQPQPQPQPPASHAAATPRMPPRVRASAQPRAPAQAGQVVAAEPIDPAAPVDLTDQTFITGTASAYAGGATTARGTSTRAVGPRELGSEQDERNATLGGVAQPVSLTSGQWRCPWPEAALAQDLYEQAVIVRAWVRADGSVEHATVVTDPGYGFGAAAIACTLRTRFSPARDAHGKPMRALSPPIRVRFTR